MAQTSNPTALLPTLAVSVVIGVASLPVLFGGTADEAAARSSTTAETAPAHALTLPAPREPGAPAPAAAASPTGAVRDCEVCPELVRVPVGEYMMGAPASDKDANAQERPQHRVRIERPFLAGKHEVTFAQWDACVAEKGCGHRPDDFGWGREDRPVMLVGWEDVQEYLTWLGAKTGKPYRLLSEAEWEYANRAGTATRYWWGDAVGTGNANCKGCGSQWDNRQTAPVGSFRPNPFGLYDTSGNVWEWVQDCWSESFKAAGNDARAFVEGAACERRVLRGGSWINKPGNLRASARAWGASDGRVNIVGFRVALDP
jgi:formylglycine-generating enzyme required for sulfatase activity